jgi:hypothetical protein
MASDWGFDLQLELTDEGYRTTVLEAPAGSAAAAFALPFAPREQHRMIQQLLQDPGEDETRRAAQFAVARELGGRLFDALFHGPIGACWQESWRMAYQERATLHLRLRLGDDPGIQAIPWEYLYDPTRDEFIALSAHTPLARYTGRAHQMLPLPVTPPLRVLVVMSGPSGYPPLPISREWRDLVDTVDYLAADRRIIFEKLPRPTLLDLQRRLRQQEFHVLHFIGFAIQDLQTRESVLVFEDENERGRLVSGQHLGALIADHYALRVALISSRNAARVPGIDPGAQVTEHLVQRGAPAAVFQPSKLLDRPSLAFVHQFYAMLADFHPIDLAVAEARRAVQLEEGGAGWGLPHLVSRIADGRLYERRGSDAAKPPAPPRLNLRPVLTPRPRR